MLIAVLSFAIAFLVVVYWFRPPNAVAVALLAAIPGILVATSRRE
jgi:hypothetical protein